MPYYYVYILHSEVDDERYYVGFTEDLAERLTAHNAGKCIHTRKHVPWRVKTAIAFTSRERAVAFETYLKTASGRAFANKRL